jgi:hypothetical protein
MIVHNFNVVRVPVSPGEAEPPLSIDPNAPLASPITLELFQMRAGRAQVLEAGGLIERIETP